MSERPDTEYLRKLLAEATPVPWTDDTLMTEVREVCANSRLIKAAVNALSGLLDEVEEATKVEQWYETQRKELQAAEKRIAQLEASLRNAKLCACADCVVQINHVLEGKETEK